MRAADSPGYHGAPGCCQLLENDVGDNIHVGALLIINLS